jgi:hypothetical protein
MELVTTDDPEQRFNGFEHFDDIALCEIIRYGVYNDPDMIPGLQQFYSEMLMEAPEEQRLSIYREVAGMVENVTHISPNALLPFIAEDTSRGIVSTAVIDLVSLASLQNDDPMTHPKKVIGLMESGFLKNTGAAFGALLNLGDQRVCQLLWPLKDGLESSDVDEAINCSTGFVYAETAEFYVNWLEGMEADLDDGLFGSVAAGLALLRKRSRIDLAFRGGRPFPVTGLSQGEWRSMRQEIPLDQYTAEIAPRLCALERTEPPPRVMPHVLVEWGLEPVTDPSERATFPFMA